MDLYTLKGVSEMKESKEKKEVKKVDNRFSSYELMIIFYTAAIGGFFLQFLGWWNCEHTLWYMFWTTPTLLLFIYCVHRWMFWYSRKYGVSDGIKEEPKNE